jgi:hypothetical protein
LRCNLCLVLLTLAAASAQEMLNQDESVRVDRALQFLSRNKAERLNCSIEPVHPFLDFSFRYEAGYVASCPIRNFEGRSMKLRSFIKIAPESGASVTLGRADVVPAIPSEAGDRIDLRKVKSAIEISGVVLLGEGDYSADMILADEKNRVCSRHWKIHVERTHAERDVNVVAAPHTVAPLSSDWLSEIPDSASHARLTLLVNAAPINPNERHLRAWDRALLLGSISSILRELPHVSVRLIAFNLDQQSEVFHDDDFRLRRMTDLSAAMEKLELGVIAVKKLQQVNGGADLLVSLSQNESATNRPSDAVVFVGPWTRMDAHLPKRLFQTEGYRPRFYDLVYYSQAFRGREFPDAIQRLTTEQDGTVYRLHSPGELAHALRKMSAQLSELVARGSS